MMRLRIILHGCGKVYSAWFNLNIISLFPNHFPDRAFLKVDGIQFLHDGLNGNSKIALYNSEDNGIMLLF
jgi:hypothetical protein